MRLDLDIMAVLSALELGVSAICGWACTKRPTWRPKLFVVLGAIAPWAYLGLAMLVTQAGIPPWEAPTVAIYAFGLSLLSVVVALPFAWLPWPGRLDRRAMVSGLVSLGIGSGLLLAMGHQQIGYESERFPTFDGSAPTHVDCMGDHFDVVTSLAALPPEVVAGLADRQVMADRGQAFNATDMVGDDIPAAQRRFGSAAVGQTKIFADVEQGGVGYHTDIWAFELHGAHWSGRQVQTGGALPEFLRKSCRS